jgi:hypothetical protein
MGYENFKLNSTQEEDAILSEPSFMKLELINFQIGAYKLCKLELMNYINYYYYHYITSLKLNLQINLFFQI